MKGILTDDDGDITVLNGSMAVGDVDLQTAERIVCACQGEFKEAPLLGGNIRGMLGGTPDPFWAGEVKRQLKNEGINAEIRIEGTTISLLLNN